MQSKRHDWPDVIGRIISRTGITRQTLADLLEVHLRTIYQWQGGYHIPGPRAQRHLIRLLQSGKAKGQIDKDVYIYPDKDVSL